MIITNLTGGLGNQMFQYAFGRTIAKKHNTNLKLHFTNALFNIQRSYALDIFNISATISTKEDLQKFGITQNRVLNRLFYLFDERYGIQFNKHIVTQRYPYTFDSSYLNIKDNSYIQGYWADEKYFKSIENIIRKEFILKKKLDERNKKITEHMHEVNSVSIHLRRKDYLTISQFIGIKYYSKAIKQIQKEVSNPFFFIFSDDILWCKEHFKGLDNVYFISHNEGEVSYKDIILMSHCKHNIVANSTFSLWGAWLNINKNKIVIKPN